MTKFFRKSAPIRDAVLSILFFGLVMPTYVAVASDCNYVCDEGGCNPTGAFYTGQGGCTTTSRTECEREPNSPVEKCKTVTTCETFTGPCGDWGPPEL